MNTRLFPSLAVALLLTPVTLAQPAGFPSYGGAIAQMQTAANNFPAICRAVNLTQRLGTPQSWQGQDIWGVKISDNVGQEEDEPAFLMVAAHHGNEYGTPIVALDAISRLTSGYAGNAQIRNIVNNNEIWIVPIVNVDGYWTSRHNRRPGGTVDLNRNYPFNWASPCNSGTRGPSAGSEPETQTIVALSEEQRFAKVLDYHSSGRETLYAYRQGCPNHQLTNWLRNEAIALSTASSYGGQVRGPSSDGEHYQHQLGTYSNYAFLTEISNTQSPSIASANTEATRLWPGTIFMLERTIPISGHITDAATGAPIEANISYVENPFTKGEQNRSEPLFGRYHAFLPNGTHTLRVQSTCYFTRNVVVNVTNAGAQVDIALTRDPAAAVGSSSVFNGNGSNPVCLSAVNQPIAGTTWNLEADGTSFPTASFVLFVGAPGTMNGPQLPAGQVLVNLNPPTFVIFAVMQNGTASASVPLASNLLGTSAGVQALLFQGDERDRIIGLCNALDYTVGCN